MSPPDEPVRRTSVAERGELLVDLLHLSDAFPPVPHGELDVPPFRDLVGEDQRIDRLRGLDTDQP